MTPTPPSDLRTVRCPHCGERLGVRAEDVGKKARCRSCGAVFRLAPRADAGPAEQLSAAKHPQATAAGPGGEAAKSTAPAATISFSCELCQTRLTTALANVGRKLACPDCGRVNLVPPPEVIRPAPPPAAMSGAQYGIWEVDREPDAERLRQANEHLHPVVCELCQTLMYASDSQVGTKLRCPDCNHWNQVRARRPAAPIGPVLVPDGEEYQLDEAMAATPRPMIEPIGTHAGQVRDGVEPASGGAAGLGAEGSTKALNRAAVGAARESPRGRPPGAPPAARGQVGRRDESVHAGKAEAAREGPGRRAGGVATRPGRPAVPLVQGVLRMLGTSEVAVRWIGQWLALAVILRLGVGIVNAMGAQALFALPMFAIACFAGGAWLLATLPLWLAVVVESAEGNDQLEDPPNWISFDVAESGMIAFSMAAAAIPAWLTTKATVALAAPWPIAIAGATWLVGFPLALLSALEQGAALAIFSPRLGFNLVRCAGPWLLFFVESTGLAAGAGYVAWKALHGPRWQIYLLPGLVMAAVLLYMRLIGRLGWWIAELTPATDDGAGDG